MSQSRGTFPEDRFGSMGGMFMVEERETEGECAEGGAEEGTD